MPPRQCRDAIEVVARHTADAHFECLSAAACEFADQLVQHASRDAITVRMREDDRGTRGLQDREGLLERGPIRRNVPGRAAREPAIEGIGDIACVTRFDQGSREM